MKSGSEKVQLKDTNQRMMTAVLSLPLWMINYLLTLFLYRIYGISGYPPAAFFLLVPVVIWGLNLLSFRYRLYKKSRFPKRIWNIFFLMSHVVNGAIAFHFIDHRINGFICFLLIVQAFIILNTSVGFLATVSTVIIALSLGPGIHYFYQGRLAFDDIFFMVAAFISALFVGFINQCTLKLLKQLNASYAQSEAAQNRIREKNRQLINLSSKLAKYLSPQVYESIFKGQKAVRMESDRKIMSVFFSDIKNFTELTDRTDAEMLSVLLNNYFDEMTAIALRYRGTIDKFIGDAMMVFFGDPETQGVKADALSCVLMAIEMKQHMVHLREKWNNRGICIPLKIRMGINTGFCTVGNFGSEDRLDYTVIGGNVNIAKRLESHAEPDQILISRETYALVRGNVACNNRKSIHVRGIAYPIDAYEVIDRRENLKEEKSSIYEKGPGYTIALDRDKIKGFERKSIIHKLRQAIEVIK
jgi:class 3 adenylate cyclase